MDIVEEDRRDQVLPQITELEEAVGLMREAFQNAQLQLESVLEEDRTLREELDSSKLQCQQQSSEIVRLILSLKSEVTSLKEMLQSTQFIQHGLQSTVQALIAERDFLLHALVKTGAISQTTRERLHSRMTGFGRPSSGSQSTTDSGVALILEKTHANFSNNGLVTSRHYEGVLYRGQDDSLPAQRPDHIIPTQHIHEYLIGVSSNLKINDGEASGGYASFNTEGNAGVLYDSDSSLTMAATKSLSLSTSLGKQCGLEFDHHDEDAKRSQIHMQKGDECSDSESPHPSIRVINVASGPKNQHNQTEDVQEAGSFFNVCNPDLLPDREVNGDSRNCCEDTGSLVKEQEAFKESQRLRVAKELVETERKYCNTLHTIQHTFAQPLKNSGILTIRDIKTLFPEEVYYLYQKHCELLKELDERLGGWEEQSTIGDILERFTNTDTSDVLRLYTSYVNDFPEVLKTFHKLCRTCGDFTRFIKSCLEHPACGGLDLGAFLLTPVQRMPRYILLLKQMIKYTVPSHPDHKDISQCLDRLRDYLKRLNDSMEHSFQLVTAQISPHESSRREYSSSQQNRFQRASISSSQSQSSGGGDATELVVQKGRYRRSTSVPRNQNELSQGKEGKVKLKSRSKSDWTVCNNGTRKISNDVEGGEPFHACSCNCNPQSSPSSFGSGEESCSKSSNAKTTNTRYMTGVKNHKSCFERTLSDSDINSDAEEGALVEKEEGHFTASKSLHDFNQHGRAGFDWTTCEPRLRSKSTKVLSLQRQSLPSETFPDSSIRNSILVRPLTESGAGLGVGNYVARIQRRSESELNCLSGTTVVPGKDATKKRTSLRTSLKNIFSLKKRVTRTLEISHPISTANGRSSGSSFSDSMKTDTFCSSPVVMTNYEPAPSPAHYFIPGSIIRTCSSTTSTTPGAHFMDEDGKPCTNV